MRFWIFLPYFILSSIQLVYQIFIVHYISVRYFIIFYIFCSVLSWWRKICIRFSMFVMFKIFHYFCHIILFSTELRNRSVLRLVTVLQSFYCFSYVTKCKRWKDNVQNCESYISIPLSKIWLIRVYLKFTGYGILQKFMTNGNLSIIASCTRFILH
jgi:predicted membrane-bound mannosyltransferase